MKYFTGLTERGFMQYITEQFNHTTHPAGLRREKEGKMKKYTVSYTSAPTGYGWIREFDRIDEFEDIVNDARGDCTRCVSVRDNELGKEIFFKRSMTYKIEVDMLSGIERDLRTTTRKRKFA